MAIEKNLIKASPRSTKKRKGLFRRIVDRVVGRSINSINVTETFDKIIEKAPKVNLITDMDVDVNPVFASLPTGRQGRLGAFFATFFYLLGYLSFIRS